MHGFRVVVTLAWFSSTTHLATLGVLRNYFLVHEVVKNWRIVGMISLLILLMLSLLAPTGIAPQTAPLQCGINLLSLSFKHLDGDFPSDPTTSLPNSTASSAWQTFEDILTLLAMLVLYFTLSWTYREN